MSTSCCTRSPSVSSKIINDINNRLIAVLKHILSYWKLKNGILVLYKSNYDVVAVVNATSNQQKDEDNSIDQAYMYTLDIKPDALQLVKSLIALHLAGSRFGK